ncbi:thioredoxin [Halobacteriales archaeon QS_1_68_20]|nr:MAG: thioredoxin [Halobacteriales archaeon QS_1_68_20]
MESGQASDDDEYGRPVEVGGSDELAVLAASRTVLVAFRADWCGPCQLQDPVLETVAADTDAAVARIDVDANPSVADAYDVRGVPTLVLLVDGERVDRLVGLRHGAELRDLLARYVG